MQCNFIIPTHTTVELSGQTGLTSPYGALNSEVWLQATVGGIILTTFNWINYCLI